MKNRNRSVKHHYIPQWYLRQFSHRYKKKGYQFAVFDRETGKSFRVTSKMLDAKIISIASR